MTLTNNLICIGVIIKAHGIIGDAKLISHAQNPEDIFKYQTLYDEQLNEYSLKKRAFNSGVFIVRLSKALAKSEPKSFLKITSRTEIEGLAGTKLYITKDMLKPSSEDEYYYEELRGLEVLTQDQQPYGSVIDVRNFGAGDLLEVSALTEKSSVFLPFLKEFITEVNLEKKYLIFDFVKSGI